MGDQVRPHGGKASATMLTGGWSDLMVILWVTCIPLFLLVGGIVSLISKVKNNVTPER